MCELRIVPTLDIKPFLLEKFLLPERSPAPTVETLNALLERKPFVAGGCEGYTPGSDDLRFDINDQQKNLLALQVQPVRSSIDLTRAEQIALLDQFPVYTDGRLILQQLVLSVSEGTLPWQDEITLVVRFHLRRKLHECWFDFHDGFCHVCCFDYKRDPQPNAIYLFPSKR